MFRKIKHVQEDFVQMDIEKDEMFLNGRTFARSKPANRWVSSFLGVLWICAFVKFLYIFAGKLNLFEFKFEFYIIPKSSSKFFKLKMT